MVLDKDLTAPPGSPSVGDRYIVGPAATGAWAGQDDAVTEYLGTAGWFFWTPEQGWAVFIDDEATRYEFRGGAWVVQASQVVLDVVTATGTTTTVSLTDVQVAGMLINAPADGTYIAAFSATVSHDTTNELIFVSIYDDAVQQAESERNHRRGTQLIRTNIAILTDVMTLTSGDAITVQWRTTAGTATMLQRVLQLIRLS